MERLTPLEHFFGYFNLISGTACILIGFGIYKPFKGEDAEKTYQKTKIFYRLGGIALLIGGLFKIFNH